MERDDLGEKDGAQGGAGHPPDQPLGFARVAILNRDWQRGLAHANGIIAKEGDQRTHSTSNMSAETSAATTKATEHDALRLMGQESELDELIDHQIPGLPDEFPSPLHFGLRDCDLFTAELPAPQLPGSRKSSVGGAWLALATFLSDPHGNPSGRNNSTFARVLHACRRESGDSYDDEGRFEPFQALAGAERGDGRAAAVGISS